MSQVEHYADAIDLAIYEASKAHVEYDFHSILSALALHLAVGLATISDRVVRDRELETLQFIIKETMNDPERQRPNLLQHDPAPLN